MSRDEEGVHWGKGVGGKTESKAKQDRNNMVKHESVNQTVDKKEVG